MPSEMATGVMLLMQKKGNRDDKANYRTLYLLTHALKTFPICLMRIIVQIAEPEILDSQARFRKSRDCEMTRAFSHGPLATFLRKG